LSKPASSNIEIRLLTALIGLAFTSSILGIFGSIRASRNVVVRNTKITP
jgi:pectate lyase